MKKIASLAFLLIFTTLIFAQKTISGKVYGEDKKPLPSASVTIEEIGKNAILSYAITDSKGNYSVTFTSKDAKVNVKVKAFNYKTTINQYDNATQTLNFTLEEQATEIKEVKLKTKLVTKRGDTISYDLKSFESKADRTLADVLKKMPGVEVNKDGTILYQGEAINKFYVNGKDLMEGGYGTINNSLPKDAVQKVEIMENHQPVKILQDKVASENAAINVKLKNSVTMTGRGEASLGVEPGLWNLKLSPMLFTPKVQWVLNYKTNNVGDQVEKEGQMLAFGSRFEGVRRNFSGNSWLNVENAATPTNIPVNRYLFNKVHYFSANLLTNLSKDWEFKANTNYTNNEVERESNETRYNADGSFYNYSYKSNTFYTNQAKGEFIFSKNANKSFFKNTTTYNGLWNTDVATAFDQINSAQNAKQRNTSPSNSFQNSLSAIIPWKEKLVNVMSFVSYRDDNQSLSVSPGAYVTNISPTADEFNQNLNLKTFETTNSASLAFSKSGFTITPEVGINYTSNNLLTDTYAINGGVSSGMNGYTNDLKFQKINPYVQTTFNFKKGGFEANLTFPINFNKITAEDATNNVDKSLNKTTYEPRLYAKYDLTSFWKISGFGGLSNAFGSVNDIYGGYILLNPRNVTKKETDIQQSNSKFVSSTLEYRNPLNNIFFNINYGYNTRTSNIIFNTSFNGLQTTVVGENLDNTSTSNSGRVELGKYFPKFKTNASVRYGLSESNYQQKINSQLQDIESASNTYSIKFNNNYFSWLSIDYNAGWTFSNNKTFNNKTKSFNHNLSAYIYPIKDHTIGFTWDDLQSNINNVTRRNSFYDVSYQYSLTKEKMDIELKVVNIANTNSFQTIGFDSQRNQTVVSNMNIRPRQVLLTVKFNFK